MYKNPAKTLFMGRPLVFVPECHSTNDEALRLCREHRPSEGTVVITSKQTGGRGLRGNRWITEPGLNLTFSVILHPHFLAPHNAFDLSRALALGIHDYLNGSLLSDRPYIKWPNDLLIGDLKICGILIENSISGSFFNYAVCGVGLNVNQENWDLPATSLSLLTGSNHDLSEVLESLLACMEARYLLLRSGMVDPLRTDYLEKLYWRGESRRFQIGENEVEGTIENVDDQGRLIVQIGGEHRAFIPKELRFAG